MAIDPEILKLVQVTTRMFYSPRYVITMDQLIRKEAMRDEELAARVGIAPKDVAKIANKLAEDGLLAAHRRNELRPGAMKASPRTWYYIDFQRTIDNIKWKMFKIRKQIDDKLRNELDSQGYNCPRCKKVFSTLDAGSLLDFVTNTMRCDVCGTDVVDNANTEEVKQSKDQMNRLLGQTKPVIDGLKKTETIPLPAFHVASWLDKHHPVATADLPIPDGSGPAKVTVELVEGGEDEARRKKEEEADARRQQNALPSWIERSTLTGELTAAGAAQQVKTGTGITISHEGQDEGARSKKSAVSATEDDVDEYYASLAASQAQNSIAPVTYSSTDVRMEDGKQFTHHGSPASNGKLVDSGYEEFGEEADMGRNVSYSYSPTPASPNTPADVSGSSNNSLPNISRSHSRVDALRPPSAASLTNSLGKRSREASDESIADDFGKKLRTGDNATGTGALDSVMAGEANRQDNEQPVRQEEEEEEEEVEDPILTVAGKEMRFSAITEEMTSDMTAEEYTLWWETLSTME